MDNTDKEMENEPEEGEIIDNYELISSDEELTMRQRIEELEAKNKELEQIAVISRSYSNNYHYSTTDAYDYHHNVHRYDYSNDKINYDNRLSPTTSLISSTELITSDASTKCRKHKIYKRKRLRTHHHSKRCKRRRNFNTPSKHNRDKNKHIAYTANSVLSSEGSFNSNADNDSFVPEIDRNTLRWAVARPTNNSPDVIKQNDVSLRERLLNDKDKDDGRLAEVTLNTLKENPQLENKQGDSSDSLEEKELRLIALKSAVLRKHLKRTKRDAESAYSPTDFDEMLNSGILNTYEVESDLEWDLINSPTMSPKLLLSPLSDRDEVLDDMPHRTSATVISQVDTKVIDMDISNSDSGDMACINKWYDDFVESTPPPPPVIATVNPIQYNYNQSANYSFGLHVSELQLEPLPPRVEYYENITSQPKALASLPNVRKEDPSVQEMELEIPEPESNFDHQLAPQPQSENKHDNSTYSCEEAEEEEALRTLLLAKMQSLRLKRQKSIHVEKTNQINRDIVKKVKLKPNNNTEIILKEAVRRFRSRECEREDQSQSKQDISILHESNVTTPVKRKQKKPKKPTKSASNTMQNFSDTPVEIIDLTNDDFVEHCHKDKHLDEIKTTEELAHFETTQVISKHALELIKEEDIRSNNYFFNAPLNVLYSNQIVSPSIIPAEVSNDFENLREINRTTENILSDNTLHSNVIKKHEHTQNCFKNDATKVSSTILSDHKTRIILDTECVSTDKERQLVNVEKDCKTKLTQNRTYNKLIKTVNQDSLKSRGQIEQGTNVCLDDTLEFKKGNVGSVSEIQVNNESFSKTEVKSVRLSRPTNYLPENRNSSLETIASQKKKFDNFRVLQNRKLPMKSQKMSLSKVHKYSPYSIFRTQKIVKPNKVINKNIKVSTNVNNKLNKVDKFHATGVKTVASTPTDLSECSVQLSEKSKVQVQRLVIDLQDLSTDSFESLKDDISPIYEAYIDNASPISLNMESSNHENRLISDSPIEHCTNTNKQKQHQQFEKKLETFLKSIRSKANQDDENTSAKDFTEFRGTPIPSVCKSISTTTNHTPVAVRHLPVAAQAEYRRLVRRMKMLENQRQLQKDTNANVGATVLAEIPSTTINGKSLCKSVLGENTTNNTTDLDQTASNLTINKNVSSSYEKQFRKICTDIVNNLDKSLRLVADAKQYKVKKLSLERRIKILKEQLNSAQRQHAAEQEKMKRILPIIGAANEVILTLKKKHSQIIKKTFNLDKTLNEKDFCLHNELNLHIAQKTKQLSKEIKVVNSLTPDNITDDCTGIYEKKSEEAINSIKRINQYNCKKDKDGNHESHALAATSVMGMQCSSNQLKVEGSSKLQDNKRLLHLSKQSTFTTASINVDNKSNSVISESGKEEKDVNIANEYESPLKHLRNINNVLDPHGILCPYNLMGDCEDTKCSYMHLMGRSIQYPH